MSPTTLQESLRKRDEDPERALSALESVDETFTPDAELLRWVAERCRPTVPAGLRGLFERSLESTGEVRRLALQKLGATA